MSGSAPSNSLFYVSTVGLILEDFIFLFLVCLLIVESFLLFPSTMFFPVFSVSVDPSLIVSPAPPVVASGVDQLLFVIVSDRTIDDSELKITGLFLPFEFNIFEFDYWFLNHGQKC